MKPVVEYLGKVTRVSWSEYVSELSHDYGEEKIMLPIASYNKESDVYCCYQTKELPPTCGLREVCLTNSTRIYRFSPGQKPVLVHQHWGDVYIESIDYTSQHAKLLLLPMSTISMMSIKYGVTSSTGGVEVIIDLNNNRLISISRLKESKDIVSG